MPKFRSRSFGIEALTTGEERRNMIRTPGSARRAPRGGSVTLEFILVLPLLVVTLFAVAQFTVALLYRQAVSHAATVAARVAGQGEGINGVAQVVDDVLRTAHGINVLPDNSSSGVRIVLEVGQSDAWGRPASSSFGDPSMTCNPPATPTVGPNQVRVTICFKLNRNPPFNWLHNFNNDYVDFSQGVFQISSLVEKE